MLLQALLKTVEFILACRIRCICRNLLVRIDRLAYEGMELKRTNMDHTSISFWFAVLCVRAMFCLIV